MIIGVFPLEWISWIAALASELNLWMKYSSPQLTWSITWCGIPSRSSIGCLLVIKGALLYTCMESALMISPFIFFASSILNYMVRNVQCIILSFAHTCDFPTPVVPTIVMTFFFGLLMTQFLKYRR